MLNRSPNRPIIALTLLLLGLGVWHARSLQARVATLKAKGATP